MSGEFIMQIVYLQVELPTTLRTRSNIDSASLSLSSVVGIAVGGAFILTLALGTIAYVCAKRRHGLNREVLEAADIVGQDVLSIKDALKSIVPQEAASWVANPSNAEVYGGEDATRSRWNFQSSSSEGPAARPWRYSLQKGLFKAISIRESWPLVTNIQLSFLPSHDVAPSQVAPPGYILQDPKRVRRASSLWIKKSSSFELLDHQPISPSRSIKLASSVKPMSLPSSSLSDLNTNVVDHAATNHRFSRGDRPDVPKRSTSETHLSTNLRSTPQRLKGAHRNSLTRTRTLSSLGRHPGRPPSERLPDPSLWVAAESREELVDKECSEYIRKSLQNTFRIRTPSLDEGIPVAFHKGFQNTSLPTPEQESPNSFNKAEVIDVIKPGLVTPPSKYSFHRGVKHCHTRKTFQEARRLSFILHKDSLASVVSAATSAEDRQRLSIPQQISLSDDPFYSSVQCSKPSSPKRTLPGPRPLYFRKATFGQEATSERPISAASPLQEVSRNTQTAHEISSDHGLIPTALLEEFENPFLRSLQDIMRTRATQTSPMGSTTQRYGHQRSKIVRLSNLPRPTSVVECVVEEPGEECRMKLDSAGASSLFRKEPSKTYSIRSSRDTSSIRSPSSAGFDFEVSINEDHSSFGDSPTLPRTEFLGNTPYPKVSASSHYESPSGCEDNITASARMNIKRHNSTYSVELQNIPTAKLETELQQRLAIGRGRRTNLHSSLISTISPPTRSIPIHEMIKMTASSNIKKPDFEVPVPPHLMGPRAEPTKTAQSPRTSDSTIDSVSLLRRWNSELSTYSDSSSAVTLPTLQTSFSSCGNMLESEWNKANCGTKNYLSLASRGMSNTVGIIPTRIKHRTSHDGSHRIDKDRRSRHRRESIPLADDNDKGVKELSVRQDSLTPVKEISSPPTNSKVASTPKAGDLSFLDANGSMETALLTPSSCLKLGRIDQTPSTGSYKGRQKEQVEISLGFILSQKNPNRYPVSTPTPAPRIICRKSKIEQPNSNTASNGLKVADSLFMDKQKDNTPLDSPGLYDQDGFLRGSPDRERTLRRKTEARKRGEISEKERLEEEHPLMGNSERRACDDNIRSMMINEELRPWTVGRGPWIETVER